MTRLGDLPVIGQDGSFSASDMRGGVMLDPSFRIPHGAEQVGISARMATKVNGLAGVCCHILGLTDSSVDNQMCFGAVRQADRPLLMQSEPLPTLATTFSYRSLFLMYNTLREKSADGRSSEVCWAATLTTMMRKSYLWACQSAIRGYNTVQERQPDGTYSFQAEVVAEPRKRLQSALLQSAVERVIRQGDLVVIS